MPNLSYRKTTKREFLKLLGVSSASLLASGSLADELLAQMQGSAKVAVIGVDQPIIYHTSTRRRKSCRACKSHAMNRIYSSRQAAEDDRAHLGCNCRIVEERIGWQNYVKAFWPGSQGGTVVYDKRWGWPPPLPTGLDLERPSNLREHLGRG